MSALAGTLPVLSPFTAPLRFGAYRYANYQRFRTEGISPEAADTMANVVSVLQLAGDELRVSALRFGGPLKRFVEKAGTSPVTRIAAHWADAAVTGTGVSLATQHLAPGFVQDVAHLFDRTVPGHDWQKTSAELLHAAPVTLATMIVKAPVMRGILRAARIPDFEVFARVPEALRRFGFRSADAARVLHAPPGEAGRVFEQTLKQHPPDPSSPTQRSPPFHLTSWP